MGLCRWPTRVGVLLSLMVVATSPALGQRLAEEPWWERSFQASSEYYLIKTDLVGSTFMHALLRAADRGVRVRLLLDDIMTKGYDAGMAGLDAHPNFQMRVFNPFNRGAAGRSLGALGSFSRINRRMHNKSFTVDLEYRIKTRRRFWGLCGRSKWCDNPVAQSF